jgi:hypothetical protein
MTAQRAAGGNREYNTTMPTQHAQKVELLNKTAEFYRRSLADYALFARTERKPRTKKQLQQRLDTILKEIDSLNPKSVS